MSFTHLHVHTTYSSFDGLARIDGLFEKASGLGLKGLAITDHGTMSGVPEFLEVAEKYPDVMPVVGCEFYLADGKISDRPKKNYHLILLAKNLTGYRTLVKLCSIAGTDGCYGGKGHIDHEILMEHHDGIIALSACIGGEIPQAILEGDMDKPRDLVLWYKNLFGEDFYLEVSAHKSSTQFGTEDLYEMQQEANSAIFQFGQEFGIKVVATNDVHMICADGYYAHQVLLCCNTKSKMTVEDRFRYTGEEYLKSEGEMHLVFPEHPEVIDNTEEVLSKIERYSIWHPVPELPRFRGTDDPQAYLSEIAFDALEKKFPGKEEYRRRLEEELEVIGTRGWADYFLIYWDLLKAVREMGGLVGPGRGSSAGLLLNYLLDITAVDPVECGLLAERFLNVGKAVAQLPDIDTDFDEQGLNLAHAYLTDTYGKDHVSLIVTFGRRSAHTAIDDTVRAMEKSQYTADLIKDAMPECRSSIRYAISNALENDCWDNTLYAMQNDHRFGYIIQTAALLEGTMTCREVHACGFILSRRPVEEYVPLMMLPNACTVTQYDAHYVEKCGLPKFDFLVLDVLEEIEYGCSRMGISPDSIPLDDAKTMTEVFGKGNTDGVFQFESRGAKTYLKEMKSPKYTDLVALEALYRPGPMEMIPEFIRRHNAGRFTCPLKGIADILGETYGLVVYQEQLMQIAKRVAGFTPVQADTLRKAVCKRKAEVLSELRELFLAGGMERGYGKTSLERFWNRYATGPRAYWLFCKAHAECYTLLGYRCGYLKAHSAKQQTDSADF